MVKNRTAGLSIGFVSQSRPREGGGRELYAIDLMEINLTSKPLHPATRVLSSKDAAHTGATRPIEVVSFEVT